VQIESKRFGCLEIDPSRILKFPEGLIGFPNCTEYVVIDLEPSGDGLKLLQCVNEPDLGFVTLDPHWAFGDYDPELCPDDLEGLDVESPDDLVLLSVVTVPKDVRKMTANLQAPLVINPKKRLGKQVIVASPEYTTKHSILRALEERVRRTG
jgi:flagellar assembly factor FliW